MLGALVVLLAFGLVMLSSSSRVRAADRFGDPFYFVNRQALWLLIALAVSFVVSRIDYHFYKRWAWGVLTLAVIGLILVFVPGIGIQRGGSYRWIEIAGWRFQPSEFAKFAMIVVLAAWYSSRTWRIRDFWRGAVIPFSIIGIIGFLLFLEPDYGTAVLVLVTGMGIMFVGGVKIAHLGLFSLCGICSFLLAVLHNPHRLGRLNAFRFPDRYPELAYQLIQSKDAFSLGGWSGLGLGESIQKHYYLPEAHTDFIFAIIGEELGLPATGAVVLLFLVIFICGLRIGSRAPDRYGRLLATGLVLMLLTQAALNIAVVTGCLPTKGITLPFISYGGSSLLMSMVYIGVLVNIAHHGNVGDTDPRNRFIRQRELTCEDD